MRRFDYCYYDRAIGCVVVGSNDVEIVVLVVVIVVAVIVVVGKVVAVVVETNLRVEGVPIGHNFRCDVVAFAASS